MDETTRLALAEVRVQCAQLDLAEVFMLIEKFLRNMSDVARPGAEDLNAAPQS